MPDGIGYVLEARGHRRRRPAHHAHDCAFRHLKKWLGDGGMVYFREPADAVLAALEVVEGLSTAKLPPGHLGVAAGPVVGQGGDYFGRTVNLAARIAAHAEPCQGLVSSSVAEAGSPEGVSLVEAGEVQLKGFQRPVAARPRRATRAVTRVRRQLNATVREAIVGRISGQLQRHRLIRHAGTSGVVLHEVISIVEHSGVAARERVVQALPLRLGRTDSLRLTPDCPSLRPWIWLVIG